MTERRSAGSKGIKGEAEAKSPSRGKRGTDKEEAHVSDALKSVYQRTVEESIPAEMLDLLSKLD
nr:NepR family anti-sigma factor [Sphingobium sp. OAS761]